MKPSPPIHPECGQPVDEQTMRRCAGYLIQRSRKPGARPKVDPVACHNCGAMLGARQRRRKLCAECGEQWRVKL